MIRQTSLLFLLAGLLLTINNCGNNRASFQSTNPRSTGGGDVIVGPSTDVSPDPSADVGPGPSSVATLPSITLQDKPLSPSNISTLNVKVEVVTGTVETYEFALLSGSSDCDGATFSAPVAISTRITETLEDEGSKTLCVRIAEPDFVGANPILKHTWVYDTTPAGDFSITGLPALSRVSPAAITWTASEDATSYSLLVSSDPNCAQDNSQVFSNITTGLSQAINPLAHGIHFICVKSSDVSGNFTTATNSPFRIEIDLEAPGNFNVITPSSIVANASPLISWSEAEDAIGYRMLLARDAACQNVVETTQQVASTFQTTQVLTHNTTYHICVTAFDAAQNATVAAPYSFTVDTQAPIVQFVSTTLPQPLGKSKAVALNVAIAPNPDVVAYRYALGPKSNTNLCATLSSYNATELNLNQRIVTNLPAADGEYQLCAIGKDSLGNWTPLANATKTYWLKDTGLPSGTIAQIPYCGTLNGCVSGTNFVTTGSVSDPVIAAAVGSTPAVQGSGVKSATISVKVGTDKYLNAAKTAFVSSATEIAIPVVITSGNFVFNFPHSLLAANKTAGITGPYTLRLTVLDHALNSRAVSANFTWDTDVPTVAPLLVSTREASSTYLASVSTRVNFINLRLAANGTLSPVQDYCVKYSRTTSAPAAPLSTDSCWTILNPSNQTISVNLSGLAYSVPYLPGEYRLFAWVRDVVGNRSAVSAPAVVNYNPIRPPVVSHLYVTYDLGDHLPKSTNIVPVGANRKVYIRWAVSTTNMRGLKNLKLYYTKDDVTYTDTGLSLVPSSRNPSTCSLSNTSSASSTLLRYAGCAEYTLPANVQTSAYLRFRVQAEDNDDAYTYGQTNALHLPNFSFLAGNTEPGLDSTATAAVIFPKSTQNLVVHPSGRVFILDNRGLLVVDPLDGVLKPYIVPFNSARKIALAPNSNLLVLENDRISKIDVNVGPSRTTIVGGGTFEDDVARDALTIAFENTTGEAIFFATQSGDIYFQSGKLNRKPVDGARIRVAKPNTNGVGYRVESINLGSNPMFPLFRTFEGRATTIDERPSSFPLNQCSLTSAAFVFTPAGMPKKMFPLFTPTGQNATESTCWLDFPRHPFSTSADYATFEYNSTSRTFSLNTGLKVPFLVLYGANSTTSGIRESAYTRYYQSLNGSLYARVTGIFQNNNSVYKYNEALNRWDRKVGALYGGECPDGTQALSCALTINSLFIDAQERIYMVDNNTVRIVLDDGRIMTIAGESLNAGDTRNPLSARFSQIGTFDLYPKMGPLSGTTLDPVNPAYVVSDMNGMRIRKFRENATIDTIAGTGVDAVDSTSGIWNMRDPKTLDLSWGNDAPNGGLSVDENGDIYVMKFQRHIPYKINAATNRWEALSGQTGAMSGMDGTTVLSGGYGAHVLGLGAGKVLFGTHNYLGDLLTQGNSRLYLMSKDFSANNLPSVALSKPNAANIVANQYPFSYAPNTMLCPNGTNRLDCNGPPIGVVQPQAAYLGSNVWALAISSRSGETPGARIVRFAVNSNPANDLVNDMLRLSNHRIRSYAFNSGNTKLYMCLTEGNSTVGKIHVHNVTGAIGNQATTFVPSAANMIKFPVDGMSCGKAGSMVFNNNKRGGTLVFQYDLNGLQGIAEFINPVPTP